MTPTFRSTDGAVVRSGRAAAGAAAAAAGAAAVGLAGGRVGAPRAGGAGAAAGAQAPAIPRAIPRASKTAPRARCWAPTIATLPPSAACAAAPIVGDAGRVGAREVVLDTPGGQTYHAGTPPAEFLQPGMARGEGLRMAREAEVPHPAPGTAAGAPGLPL